MDASTHSGNTRVGIKGFIAIPVAERFWEKVRKAGPDECWRWLGGTRCRPIPYGAIWIDGRHRPAAQVSWELAHQQAFPKGMMACHSCDNPICVNPAHIWPGTAADNQRDAAAKGRINPLGWALRTHCMRGHEYTAANTIIRSNGHRTCRTCQKLRNSKRYAG